MTYSTLINGLKVILPLMALALLSTVFLFARVVPEEAQLPFVEDLRNRSDAGNGMGASFYTGSTEAGDAVTIEAEQVLPDPVEASVTRAVALRARIGYIDGSDVTVVSQSGAFDDRRSELTLRGNVVATLSTGYVLTTDALVAQVNEGRATSDLPVRVDGPLGVIEAGGMEFSTASDARGGAHLVFTNGVKLVYTPQRTTE